MKKLAATLIFVMALAGCRNAPPTYENAVAFVEKGDLAAARIELMNILKTRPDDVRALSLMATIQIATGDGMGAENTLQHIGRKQSLSEEQRGQLAESLLLQDRCDKVAAIKGQEQGSEPSVLRVKILCAISEGDRDKAQTLVSEAEQRFAGHGALTVTRGRFALLTGDVVSARALARLATQRLPKNFDAALLNGQVALAEGDYTAALNAFERSSQFNPVSVAPLFAKGSLLAEMGRKDELDAVIARAEKLGPGRGEVHMLKAESAVLGNDLQTAQNELNAARKTLATNPALRMLDAKVALKLGNAGIAISQLQPLVATQPGFARARLLLAEAHAQAGEPKIAADILRPAASLREAPHEYVAAMAKYTAAANLPEASIYAQRAQYPAPERIANAMVEADSAMQRKDWQGAVIRYEALIKETGKANVVLLNNLGWAQFELGQTDKAIAALKQAVAIAPTNSSARDSYGWVLWKTGVNKEEGLAQLRKAAAISPDNQAIAAHLAEASK